MHNIANSDEYYEFNSENQINARQARKRDDKDMVAVDKNNVMTLCTI